MLLEVKEDTMVKLEAVKENGNIIISEDNFEHLLNCLDNQKFISVPEEQSEWTKENMQDYIDDFNKQCRKLLQGGKND